MFNKIQKAYKIDYYMLQFIYQGSIADQLPLLYLKKMFYLFFESFSCMYTNFYDHNTPHIF